MTKELILTKQTYQIKMNFGDGLFNLIFTTDNSKENMVGFFIFNILKEPVYKRHKYVQKLFSFNIYTKYSVRHRDIFIL